MRSCGRQSRSSRALGSARRRLARCRVRRGQRSVVGGGIAARSSGSDPPLRPPADRAGRPKLPPRAVSSAFCLHSAAKLLLHRLVEQIAVTVEIVVVLEVPIGGPGLLAALAVDLAFIIAELGQALLRPRYGFDLLRRRRGLWRPRRHGIGISDRSDRLARRRKLPLSRFMPLAQTQAPRLADQRSSSPHEAAALHRACATGRVSGCDWALGGRTGGAPCAVLARRSRQVSAFDAQDRATKPETTTTSPKTRPLTVPNLPAMGFLNAPPRARYANVAHTSIHFAAGAKAGRDRRQNHAYSRFPADRRYPLGSNRRYRPRSG